jgi:hypothetical protein
LPCANHRWAGRGAAPAWLPRRPEHDDVLGSIAVLEAPDKFMPIGVANCQTHDENGLAVWELTVRGVKLPGQWVIVDREFRLV